MNIETELEQKGWKPNFKPKAETSKDNKNRGAPNQSKYDSQLIIKKDIKYFNCWATNRIASYCLNKIVIILKDDGNLRLKVNLIPLEDARDVEYLVDKELLVVKRALSIQIKED